MAGAFELQRVKKRRDPDLWLKVDLVRWEWEYSLASTAFEGTDPLDEYDTLRLIGTTRITKRQQLNVNIQAFGAPRFREDKRQGQTIEYVGHLTRIKGGFEGTIGVPITVFPMVLSMLAGNRYGQIELSLIAVRPRHYSVRGYYFKHGIVSTEGGANG